MEPVASMTYDAPFGDIFRRVDRFSRQMYHIMAERDSNLFISPFCLHSMLAMLYEGSAADTRMEFELCLNFDRPYINMRDYKALFDRLDGMEEIHLIRKIYIQDKYRVKEIYKEAVNAFFAEIERINYVNNINASQIINSWFCRQTDNQILNITNPGDFHNLTRMVSLTAASFKLQWLHKFDPSKTEVRRFFLPDSTSINCEMMFVSAEIPYAYNRELDADVLRLPFTNNSLCLMLIVPRNLRRVSNMEEEMLHETFRYMLQNLKKSRQLNIHLPKFLIEQKYNFTNKLRTLGFWRCFDDVAEFTHIIEEGSVRLSKIIQKTTIGVDEYGVDSAIIRGHGTVPSSTAEMAPRDPNVESIIINRPFVFAIMLDIQKNYCPLAVGKVYTP